MRKFSLEEYGIQKYKVSGEYTVEQAYKEKVLSKFYRRKISQRKLELSREECDKKYGTGDFFHLNVHSNLVS